MAHIVTVTIAGGGYWGPENDTPTSINADKILEIKDAGEEELGSSIIRLDDNSKMWVVETQDELKKIINE
ncbi:MAG: hypothetical protein K8R67_15635 [Desulfobacteraceae bacterium]|nr:hypothetical protein [Desulfobacteraceae bacterium]